MCSPLAQKGVIKALKNRRATRWVQKAMCSPLAQKGEKYQMIIKASKKQARIRWVQKDNVFSARVAQ
jgi:hypothetical protein